MDVERYIVVGRFRRGFGKRSLRFSYLFNKYVLCEYFFWCVRYCVRNGRGYKEEIMVLCFSGYKL